MISFVVPAYNEQRLLGRTLAAIHSAARELAVSYELIVVDDASTDGTADIARTLDARVVPVQFRQISRTRNAGAQVATGDTLIFVDADTMVSADALRASVDALRQGAAGGGAAVVFEGRVPLYARLFTPLLNAMMRFGGLAAGCYVFCSRASFDAAGGFDEHLYAAEEIFFSRALRQSGRVVIGREPVATSGRKLRAYSAWTFLGFCAQAMLRGTGLVRSRKRLAMWYERRDDPDSSA